MRKATGQTIWIIVTIVVVLIVALILATLMNTTTGKTRDSTEKPMEDAGNALKIDMCKRACDACMRVDPSCPDWDGVGKIGEGCDELGVSCPY
ncbi:MAG: hypothetical protein DRN71_01645 [Candidatus Nanohalarchaeota archaeon]|nr:MAG: hypothetical protein DRN71_01645 [Candidatus Nanohaloarchaeota archaeon]